MNYIKKCEQTFLDLEIRWSIICFLALILLTACLYLKELSLLIYPHNYFQILDYIPDETLFYDAAAHYRLYDGMVFGYGYIFWLFSHLLIRISPYSFDVNIILFQAICLFFKYMAFVFGALSVKKLKDNFSAVMLYLTLLITPGFYFYGKVYSVEYLLLFLSALAIFFLVSRRLYLLIFTVITATFIKLYAAPLLLLIIWGLREKYQKKVFFVAAAVMVLSIVINALPLFTSTGLHNTLYWLHKNINQFVFTSENFNVWYNLNARTWDQIPLGGIKLDFSPILIIPFALLLTNTCQSLSLKRFCSSGIVILISGCIIAGAILCYSGKLYWYLFLPYFLIMVGLFSSVYNGKRKIIVLFVVIAACVFNYSRIHWRMQDRAWHNNQLKKNALINKKINHFLHMKYPNGGVVFSDILVGNHLNKPFQLISLRRALISAEQEHITNKNYGKRADFLIVNRKINSSPLLTLFYSSDTDLLAINYEVIKNFDGLILMKRIN